MGVAIWDRDLRYQRVNRALAAIHGIAPEEFVGRHVSEILPGPLGDKLAERLQRVMSSGHATPELEVSGELRTDPGHRRWWLATYYPLHDADGEIVGAGALVREETERKEAELLAERREREATFLAEASVELAASLDYRATLRTAARLAVPALADWCAIDVREENGRLRRVALAHADPAKESAAWELTRRYPSGAGGLEGTPKTFRSSTRELVTELSDAFLERIAHDEEHLRLLRELGFRSLMVVPLRARGRTFGAMALVSSSSERRFDENDLALAENLADRCALAADNARLFGEREYIARALQRSLLPPRLPEIPGVELAARYRPASADVGGDFYDVFPTADGCWGVAIGDVSGKGPDAAAVTALARHTLHVAAAYEQHPSRVLATLNDVLLEDSPRPLLTATYARLSPSRPATIEVASGGHPLPLIVRAGGGVEHAGKPGTLLGFAAVPEITDREYALEPGDAVVLYTDGVIESRPIAGALGSDGLASLLAECSGWGAEEIADAIEEAVEERSERQADDVAVLVLRVLPR